MNVNTIELMPVAQSFAGLSIHRGWNRSATPTVRARRHGRTTVSGALRPALDM